MPLSDAEERSKIPESDWLYVEDSREAIELMMCLQLEGYVECFARDPVSGKYLKIEILGLIHLAESGDIEP